MNNTNPGSTKTRYEELDTDPEFIKARYKKMKKQRIDYEKYRCEIVRYHHNEYLKLLNLDSIDNRTLREYLKSFKYDQLSHKSRLGNIQILKYSYQLSRTSTVVACFKATLDQTSCIYAYLYSLYDPKSKNSPVEFGYVCHGPTLTSQDGEHRSRFILWTQYIQLMEVYPDVVELVEEKILAEMVEGRLSFHVDFYYPIRFRHSKRKFEDMVNESRAAIYLFILCWLYDTHSIHYKINENHMNPAYYKIFTQLSDIRLLKNIESIFERRIPTGYAGFKESMTKYYEDIKNINSWLSIVQCCQKIFPLSALEAARTDDINFNVWREIYITNLASNLVLNLISPSFPFINDWFYIQNAHPGLFDNIAMYDKYVHSEIAAEISAQLRRADKYNYVNNDLQAGPISNKFYRLSKQIQKAIVYADSEIRLTDLAVCMTSEYVGRTLLDIPNLLVRDELPLAYKFLFSDYDVFAKHIFEFIYSLYCMNEKIGTIHGDLHTNNCTIMTLYIMLDSSGKEMYIERPHVAYVIGNECYALKHYGLISMIIDFSRAIIGDYTRIEHEFSRRFAESYFKEQRVRLMYSVYQYYPQIIDKYRDQIDSLLLGNFRLMFKIFSAIDALAVGNNFLTILEDKNFTSGRLTVAPKARSLVQKVIKRAEDLLVENIHAAISGQISSADEIEWPNLVILKDVFSAWKLTPERMKEINIVDVFNFNNEIIYEIEDVDTWGPLISLHKTVELRKKYNIDTSEYNKAIEHFLRDESQNVEALTSKYEQKEKETLDYEPWMLM